MSWLPSYVTSWPNARPSSLLLAGREHCVRQLFERADAMTTRRQLLQRWEAGLHTNAETVDASSRFHWVRRAYVRIYRFLISRYGSGQWRVDSATGGEAPVEVATSPMPFVDNTGETTGCEPKSGEQIRDKLAAIRDANDNPRPLGTATKLTSSDWVALASTKDRKTADRIRCNLIANGLRAVTTKRTTDYSIQVRYGDFDEGLLVLQRGRWRAEPTKIRSFRLTRTTGLSPPRGVRFLLLLGLTVGGVGACLFAAQIITSSIAYSPRETLIAIGIFVALVVVSVRRGA